MKLLEINSQYRRDFQADMKCEFCGNIEKDVSGYDDRYYHDKVIPDKKCGKCNKSTNSEGGTIDKTITKYSENQII